MGPADETRPARGRQAAALVRVGPYRVEGELGRGGMGVVYRAFDERLHRAVALKALPADLATDPAELARLEREARALAAVSDPHVAAIHGIEESGGTRYLVLELVEGQTLRRALDRGPLPPAQALSICAQVAAGLGAVHRRRLVHRDLKPGNVMLTPEGVAKLLDFGLAKRAGAGTDLTGRDELLGTLGYMSPEQVRGEPLDERSDAWAWGCLLFECLTGKGPFAGDGTADAIAATLHREPAWTQLPAETPAHVVDLLRSCLAKDRAARPASMEEVRRVLEGGQQTAPPPARVRRGRAVALGLGGVALVVLLGVLAVRSPAWRGAPRAETAVRSLAVLPITSASGDASQDHLAAGLTDSLIGELARIRSLRVISRTSVMALQGQQHSLPELGELLGVDALVEGTVAREGSHVRVSMRLVDARTERRLWRQDYDREIAEVLDLQSEVARAVAGQVSAKLTPEEDAHLATARRVNPAAYELYLKGRLPLETQGEEGYRSAVELFNQAIAEDPQYALAWSGLADAYYMMSNMYLPPHQAMPMARHAAMRALQLDPGLAEAHVSLASVLSQYEWKWAEAMREIDRAIELEPSYAPAHYFRAIILSQTGKLEEASESYERSRALDPLSVYTATVVSQPAYLLGRCDELMARSDPKNTGTPLTGLCDLQLGRKDEAVAKLRDTVARIGHPYNKALLGMALVKVGKADEARAILAELRSAKDGRVLPYGQAVILAALGDKDGAFEWLERGLQERDENLNFLKVDPHLKSLAGDQRFTDLLRRMDLAD